MSHVVHFYPLISYTNEHTHLTYFFNGIFVSFSKAYGEVGGYGSESINKIKPGATLTFSIELLDILDEDAAGPHLVWGL